MTVIYISPNNSKIACPSFSIPSKRTCEPKLACWKYCYASHLEKMYPSVKKSYLNNLRETYKEDFVDNMANLIKIQFNPKYFRIHVGGDFYSKEYGEQWSEIAKKVPDTIFYTYTKREFMKDVVRPKNFILYWSIDGVKEYPLGTKVPTVPQGFDGVTLITKEFTNCPNQLNKNVKCGGGCNACMVPRKTPLIFKLH